MKRKEFCEVWSSPVSFSVIHLPFKPHTHHIVFLCPKVRWIELHTQTPACLCTHTHQKRKEKKPYMCPSVCILSITWRKVHVVKVLSGPQLGDGAAWWEVLTSLAVCPWRKWWDPGPFSHAVLPGSLWSEWFCCPSLFCYEVLSCYGLENKENWAKINPFSLSFGHLGVFVTVVKSWYT